jgi:hypothetical protein
LSVVRFSTIVSRKSSVLCTPSGGYRPPPDRTASIVTTAPAAIMAPTWGLFHRTVNSVADVFHLPRCCRAKATDRIVV